MRGAVFRVAAGMRPAEARAPFTRNTVVALEGVLHKAAQGRPTAATAVEAAFVGSILLCLFGRLRYGDLSRVTREPVLETAADGAAAAGGSCA